MSSRFRPFYCAQGQLKARLQLLIIDDRHGATSTVIISQLRTDQWYSSIGDNILADAIPDRLTHNRSSTATER